MTTRPSWFSLALDQSNDACLEVAGQIASDSTQGSSGLRRRSSVRHCIHVGPTCPDVIDEGRAAIRSASVN